MLARYHRYQRSRETRLMTEHLIVSYRRFQEQYFYHSLIRDSEQCKSISRVNSYIPVYMVPTCHYIDML